MFVRLQFLQRLPVNARNNTSGQPTRFAHLNDDDQSLVRVEDRKSFA